MTCPYRIFNSEHFNTFNSITLNFFLFVGIAQICTDNCVFAFLSD